MDARRQQRDGAPYSLQHSRFSWQIPAESTDPSTSAPGPQPLRHVPTEPSIAQSPSEDAPTPASAWRQSGQYPHNQSQVSAQGPPSYTPQHQASSMQPPLVVPYAITPQARLSLQTNHANPNQPSLFSPSSAPIPVSEQDSKEQGVDEPATATSASPDPSYTPHATTSKNTFSKSDDNKGGLPFSPDDLVRTHTDAVIAQGRTPTLPLESTFSQGTNLHQPGQVRHPNMKTEDEEKRMGEWKHGLMGCASDMDTCCLGFACPCILHSRTSYRLSARRAKRDPTDLLGFKSCNGTCAVMALSLCLGFVFPAISRTRIRHQYKIDGGAGGDFCTGCLCCCCVVVQNEREVADREDSRRRWAGPATGAAVQYAPRGAQMRYASGGGG